MKHNISHNKKGQAVLLSLLVFLGVSVATIFAVSLPVIEHIKITRSVYTSKQNFYAAESLSEDIAYRLQNSISVSSSESLTVGGSSATASIVTSGGNKDIEVTAQNSGLIRKIKSRLTTSTGIAFNYGLQAGNGGMTIDGGSTIIGNLYANGSINAISATITGTAVAADSSATSTDQINNTPATPTASVNFRNVSASRDLAQSFQVSDTSPLGKVGFYIKKTGSPADATIKIVADSAGTPSSTVMPIGTATLSAGGVTTSYGWVDVTFATPVSLIPSTRYWIIVQSSTQSATNYYTIGANTSTSTNNAKTGTFGGTWTNTNLNTYYKTYLGGTTATIGGASYSTGFMVGSSTALTGDAWARTVKGTTAYGKIYCLTGTNNNKSCDTSKGVPSPTPLPFSDANLDSWKDSALAGGTTTGNVTVGFAGATMGPKKITGNLLVNGGGTLTLTGPLWVVGTVTVTGGGKIKLQSGYGRSSETIISDGTITISGGGSLGSGTTGSYLFVVSTSQCPNAVGCSGANAISISGGAGAIAANAQYGTVGLSGGASISAVVGNQVSVTGGSTVTYDNGLASPEFNSGPAGGYTISSWQEIQ
ncbi:MAG: hypothetical protein RLY57_318 [Candidatus Parcubacteria bacterium]|jgi:hypothetical protein